MSRRGGSLQQRVGGVEISETDVGESYGSLVSRGDERGVGGISRGGRTGSSCDPGGGRARGHRVSLGVEPQHVLSSVIPQAQDEDHASGERSAHRRHPTLLLENVRSAECCVLVRAERVSGGVVGCHSGDIDFGIQDQLSVLNVISADLGEGGGRSSVNGEELGQDGKRFGRIDDLVWTIERLVSKTIRVEVTSSRVANACARRSDAVKSSVNRARMGSVSSS